MTCLRPFLGGRLGFKPRFVSIRARDFYSLKYRNQGLLSAGALHSGSWHLCLTEALPGRCILATKVLVILVFAGLWRNRTEYLKLGQSLAFRVYEQPSFVLGGLPLLKTLRHLGKAHSRKVLVPAQAFEHQGVNFLLCQ